MWLAFSQCARTSAMTARKDVPMRKMFYVSSVLAALAAPAMIHAADDVVTLTSGNRMAGEIRDLSRGELEFSIDGVRGWSFIDWSNIASLQSTQRFEIVLASGERIAGVIASLSKGQLEIQTDAGRKTITQADVIFMRSVGATFVDRLEGSVDLGLEFLTADDEIDWTLNTEAIHRTRNYLSEVSISSLLRRRDDVTAQRRNHFELTSRRLLERRWFVLGDLQAEEDQELDLDSRFLFGVAAGRTLVQSNRTTFAVYGGFDVSREKFSGLDVDNVPEALAAIEWDWFEISGDLELLLEATTYHALDDGRVRVEVEGSVRHDILGDYYLSLNVFESYNSDPPAGLEKSDLGVSFTIGRSF
jgi:hypothetical protein